MNVAQMFELILSCGTKNTTYKYCLLTSIVDYVIENPEEPQVNNFHFIPIFYLTKQFLAYFFPLVLNNIKQGPGKKGLHPTTSIGKLVSHYINNDSVKDELPFELITENTNKLMFHLENIKIPPELLKLLHLIRKDIIDQPIQHIRKVNGEIISIFGLLSKDINFNEDYNAHRKSGQNLKWSGLKYINNWHKLLDIENLYLFFSHQTYTEISSLRFWLRDVLIKRWAQKCNKSYNKDNEKPILHFFDEFKKSSDRDSVLMNKYRLLYFKNSLTKCIFCGSVVTKDLHLDHLIPWSRYPVNGFWNLYPSCPSCNLTKSNKIPELTKKREKNIKNHLGSCLNIISDKNNLIQSDLEFLYSNKFKSERNFESSNETITREIYEYISSIINNLQISLPGHKF
ncbi:MAG: HNH endonuclease [Candidatus Heimdallarchaeaceae archaeon]